MLITICMIAGVYAAILLFHQASITIWILSYFLFTLLIYKFSTIGVFGVIALVLMLGAMVLLSYKPLRQKLLSQMIFKALKRVIPEMSSTEREALLAGTVGFEGELFSGHPNFTHLLQTKPYALRDDELEFLNGPVNTLCRMINDWDITHVQTDLPEEIWSYIKSQGFLGMIIPKQYGGLELSATAQMRVLVKLYGRSVTVATTVSVPNSLGPAELLLKYGTESQKNYYLPRLAAGEDIPCFALTGPNAGSDAASIPDLGIVCRKQIEGKEILGIELNWDKRYITLCPVATVIGLAFRMQDPNHLLGDNEDIGITCALIPANTPGVTTGRRHFPLNTAFMNGPTQGKNVFISFEYIIGGLEMAGKGWRMLMECLSAGRAISLPSSASGGIQAAMIASGAYARVRRQFNQPIGIFEGIEEPLARIAGQAYIVDSALTMTASAIDRGEHPAVAGAILKYHTTERARAVSMDAMDIHGGKGICLGPKNYLGRGYQSTPIAITVEGANILTRSLIIFGQGAIRCHPYVFKEMQSIESNDISAFDQAFWSHAAYFVSNFMKTLFWGWTLGRGLATPQSRMKPYYQSAIVFSARLAFLSDFCMLTLGASLKRKEKLSARLGDLLSKLYLISAVLKRYQDEGEPAADEMLVDWSLQSLFYECELALRGIIVNFPSRALGRILSWILMPLGSWHHKPHDTLGSQVAKMMIIPNDTRTKLGSWVFKESLDNCPLGQLEEAFYHITYVADLERQVVRAYKEGQLKSLTLSQQIIEAEGLGLIDASARDALLKAEQMRQHVIAVDDFDDAELRRPKLLKRKPKLM